MSRYFKEEILLTHTTSATKNTGILVAEFLASQKPAGEHARMPRRRKNEIVLLSIPESADGGILRRTVYIRCARGQMKGRSYHHQSRWGPSRWMRIWHGYSGGRKPRHRVAPTLLERQLVLPLILAHRCNRTETTTFAMYGLRAVMRPRAHFPQTE